MNLSLKRISQLGGVVTGKTPSTSRQEFFGGKYQFVTPSDLEYDHYYCRTTERTVTEEAKSALPNQFIPADAVMFTCIGATIGKCGIAPADCLTNQQINSVVANERTDSKFLYYLLCHNVEVVKGLGGGSATPIVSKSKFEQVELLVPPFCEQQAIAATLSAYDDLIENNRRRMALLEEAARQLYREWFVRRRFPGHKHTRMTNGVPEGWKRLPLGDRVTLNYGKALKAEDRAEGPCPVYGSSGIVGTHEKSLAAAPGIVVGRKGNVGSVFWCPKDYWPIDTVYFIDADTSNLWLYYALQHMHFISTDVAVPGLNRDFAYSRPLLVPEPRIFRDFLELAVPLHQQITKVGEMNDKLRVARDLLLPRLMSGEIVV